MITYTTSKSNEELMQILELQKRNLQENLEDEEKVLQGFVTVKHSLEILQQMNNTCPHTIAKQNNKVIGYALSMTKNFASDIDVLKPMFLEISKTIKEENYIVMGQICIDKEYRGIGVFRGLYKHMAEEVCKSNYDIIITEIDVKNERSLNAHKNIGFKNRKDYFFENKNWRIVSLKI